MKALNLTRSANIGTTYAQDNHGARPCLVHTLSMPLFYYYLQLYVCDCLSLSCQGQYGLRIRIRTRQMHLQNQKYYLLRMERLGGNLVKSSLKITVFQHFFFL